MRQGDKREMERRFKHSDACLAGYIALGVQNACPDI